MPFEIKELVIRAVVTPSNDRQSAGAMPVAQRQQIVADCIEQVLDVLRARDER